MKTRKKKQHILRRYLSESIDHEKQDELFCAIDEFAMEHPDGKVVVFINSPGGIAEVAFAIRDYIDACPLQINTVAQGEVGSAAIIILLAGKERFISKNAVIVFHRPWKQTDSKLFEEDARWIADDLMRIENVMLKMICEKTNKDRLTVKSDLNRFRIFNTQEALDYGLVQKII